ncbi:hypothetical protein ACFL5O_00050 [Myxococcota bacterium]
MNTLLLQFLSVTVAGFINRNQQGVIEYLREENRVLREQLGGRDWACSLPREAWRCSELLLSRASLIWLRMSFGTGRGLLSYYYRKAA